MHDTSTPTQSLRVQEQIIKQPTRSQCVVAVLRLCPQLNKYGAISCVWDSSELPEWVVRK